MDDNNKQSSVINDQSSDKTGKPENQQINQSEAPVEEPKSAADKASGAVEPTTESNDVSENQGAKQTPSEQTGSASGALQPDEATTSNEAETTVADEPTTETKQEPVQPAKSDNPNAKWYVVHTYSGHENKVAHTLKQRIESEHLENNILDILVPMQNKIEIKGGKKVNVKEKIFPGYILVKMVLDDTSWLAVRTTQGVTSFVGISNKPTPISEAEVATIVKFTQTQTPQYKQVFMANDTVKIVDGPFADFIGKIDSVDEEKGKVRVLVSIFGRETPVELDFLQVKKI